MHKFYKRFIIVGIVLLLAAWGGYQFIQLDQPDISEDRLSFTPIVHEEGGVRVVDDCWYRENRYGLWEVYISGQDYERGRVLGALAEEQIVKQEEYFVAQIKRLIPSELFLKTLKFGVSFFNRNMDEHVIPEYQRELFGISSSFSTEFDFIGPKYARILNYHAAHDIGHALQDLSIVGCSSFAVNGGKSSDQSLLIARNFDFYMGDDFAKNKLVLFNKPINGIPYASITWAGFMGVVSGMNLQGLTVTLNASKSAIPNGAKTPISLLAREILQYASNIDEAIQIAKKRETFVSESILIGSAKDGKAVVIEKSPEKMDVFDPEAEVLISTNHYQSEAFKNDEVNLENVEQSDSQYRFDRLEELLVNADSLGPEKAATILRERKGVEEVQLGMGNPKAINQLLAHHGILFQPDSHRFWISTSHFQLGAFICYDLDDVFQNEGPPNGDLIIDSLSIKEDPFIHSESMEKFQVFKELKNELFDSYALGRAINWSVEKEEELIGSNPESYVTFMALGDYYWDLGNCEMAKEYYQLALTKEVASVAERTKIESSIEECDG